MYEKFKDTKVHKVSKVQYSLQYLIDKINVRLDPTLLFA